MPEPQLSAAKRHQRTQAFTSHMASASLERQLVAAQTAKTDLETKLREKDLIIERLEGDRRWLAEREQEEREEKERERTEREEEKRKSDGELRSLRASMLNLEEQHENLKDEHSSLTRSTSQTLGSQKSHISTLTRQVFLLEEELAEYRHIAEERSHAYEELQAQLDHLNASQDSSIQQETDEESWAVVRAELHRQAEYMRTLETSNAKMNAELVMFRERQAKIEVLKEQKRGLERKVKEADELREQVGRLEAELEAARREREEWASNNAGPSTPSKTPVSITQSLANLRITHARLLEEHGSNVAVLRRREAELANSEKRCTELEESLTGLQAEVRSYRTKVARSEHDAILAEREASFLRAMVASFTAEEASQNGVRIEEATVQQVQQLEQLVADYRSTVKELEKELDALGGNSRSLNGAQAMKQLQDDIAKDQKALFEIQQTLKESENENEKYIEKIDELEQTLFELRGEIGGGRHLPPGVRVLSLKDNPAQQWEDLSQAAMERLKGENEALIKRLKELEDSGARGQGDGGSNEELVPRKSWEVVNKEKARLEEELKQKEKRLMRLQQIFHAKSAEFREAIASILGVKLAFYPNGQVRVTSQFDLNAAFVFQPTGAGEDGMKMQLVAQGEGGPEDLPQLMRYWVEQEQCIPGFLASITLQCYENDKIEREREQGRPY
ncbi:uncharacterized protein FIBRA_02236 [Fibroporia radiculosa]|uniref:Spindle assembly checkpoint component MAD1 n=1 Tax=Fibroporia radiculosa TaxID=599839 RepID=J4G1F8_9APHY|nr:uncharacterized protein FIBRA_02236 [Fibroporia radiculosa]CCM00208.1 predicted protein [Fibroporia radiculosa]